MPQEPKKKHSKSRKRTRRASIMLKSLGLVTCSNCSAPRVSHIVCSACGFYEGKQIITKTKATVTKA